MSAEETARIKKLVAEAVEQGVIGAVFKELLRDPDVTDDVAAREFFRWLQKHVPAKHAADYSGADAVRWVSGWTAKLRKVTSRAVAAALDEEPDASEEDVAAFVHHNWIREFGAQHAEFMQPGMAFHLSRHYAAQCKASGLKPARWGEALWAAVDAGDWAFRRG